MSRLDGRASKGRTEIEKTGPLDDMRRRRSSSIRAPEQLLLSKKHTQNRLGSLGEGGRAERPLKIRNGHVEQAQASQGPGQQQCSREGKPAPALAGRNGNLTMDLPIRLLGPQLSRLALPVFFLSCPVRPQSRQHRRDWLGSTWPACRVSRAPMYLLTWVPTSPAHRSAIGLCVCLGVLVCARWPPAVSGLEGRKRRA